MLKIWSMVSHQKDHGTYSSYDISLTYYNRNSSSNRLRMPMAAGKRKRKLQQPNYVYKKVRDLSCEWCSSWAVL